MLNQLCFLDAGRALRMTAAWRHPREAWGEEPSVPEVLWGLSVLLHGVTWQPQVGFDEAVATDPKHPVYFFPFPTCCCCWMPAPSRLRSARNVPFWKSACWALFSKCWKASVRVISLSRFLPCFLHFFNYCQELCKCNAEGKKWKCTFCWAG